MAITIELTPEEEQRWHEVEARGINMERLVKGLMNSLTETKPVQYEVLTGQAWHDAFDSYIASRPKNTPVLSDEDMSRKSIYGERG